MRVLIIMLLSISVLQISAQSASTTQKTLITKRTATWCPNCGTWGWDMAEGVEALNKTDAILIRAHHSGTLESQVAKDITDNFGANYQPEFYINEEVQSVGSSNWSSKVSEFGTIIDENSAEEPNVSFILSATYSDNDISVVATAEVMNSLTGDYYLAAYLLEDNVIAAQSSQSGESVHNSVLRDAFSEGSFGIQIIEGSAELGTVEELEATISVEGEPVADRDFKVLVVVWEKVDNIYKVENIHETRVNMLSSNKEEDMAVSHFSQIQTAGILKIDFTTEQNLQNIRLQLHTLDGRLLTSENRSSSLSENNFTVDVNKWSGKIVLVTVFGDNSPLFTEKILIK